MDSEKKRWYGYQILFCLFLILLSALIIIESLRMSIPLIRNGQATVLDMPGLAPILCAALLILLSVVVLVESRRNGGSLALLVTPEMGEALRSTEAKTVYKVFGLFIAYIFFLLPHLPYWASTVLFMVAFMATFKTFSWKTLAVSVLTTAALTYFFGSLFHIRLPG